MKALVIWLLPLFLVMSGMAHAYDAAMAEKIHQDVTGKIDQQALAKGGCKMTSTALLEKLAKKEPVFLLDVRTPAEQQVVAVSVPGAVEMPLDRLMLKENLDRLPTDRPIVVICHTGARAAAATMALRSVGFGEARFLAGGMVDLVTQLTPKTAP